MHKQKKFKSKKNTNSRIEPSSSRFGYTILIVDDVIKSLEFYEKIFGLTRKFVTPGNEYGELNTGSTTLAFATKQVSMMKNSLEDNKCNSVVLSFKSDDVDGDFELALTNGATKVSPPEKKPWGQTSAAVRDINGVLVEIGTPMN
jgi:lactoylglutathione lyase